MQETTKNKQIKSFALRTISCTNNRPWIRKERAIEIKISLTGWRDWRRDGAPGTCRGTSLEEGRDNRMESSGFRRGWFVFVGDALPLLSCSIEKLWYLCDWFLSTWRGSGWAFLYCLIKNLAVEMLSWIFRAALVIFILFSKTSRKSSYFFFISSQLPIASLSYTVASQNCWIVLPGSRSFLTLLRRFEN